ncbi:MAG TPA: AMP-binding protein, partial [Syntrophorhabdaceae bacterium]|nr:AMP-binding protein [Syntrophorhabdaceae bacterium]
MVSLLNFSIPEIFNQADFMVDRHIKEGRAKNTAIHYRDEKITYEELSRMVNKCGNALKGLGVEIENRVLMVLSDCPEFFYTYLGAMKIGAIPIPVNIMAQPRDYEYFLDDSRAT